MKNIITILCLSFANIFYAQNREKVLKENQEIQINKELLKNFFNEVHQGSQYIYDKERERIYLEQLSRIEIISVPYVENKNLVNLSSIDKMTKYNPDLIFDLSNFNPNEFNFIKYSFNFYSSSDQFIRVDNKDFIIHILPYTK